MKQWKQYKIRILFSYSLVMYMFISSIHAQPNEKDNPLNSVQLINEVTDTIPLTDSISSNTNNSDIISNKALASISGENDNGLQGEFFPELVDLLVFEPPVEVDASPKIEELVVDTEMIAETTETDDGWEAVTAPEGEPEDEWEAVSSPEGEGETGDVAVTDPKEEDEPIIEASKGKTIQSGPTLPKENKIEEAVTIEPVIGESLGYAEVNIPTITDVKVPFEVLRFESMVSNGRYVNLIWETISESTLDYYEVERAIGEDEVYEAIAVASARSTDLGAIYEYQDTDIRYNKEYLYRLKMIDKNGRAVYSEVARIKILKEDYTVLAAYPNPTSNLCSMKFDAPLDGDLEVSIQNVLGIEISHLSISLPSGMNIIELDLAGQPTGFYTIVLRQNNFKWVDRVMKL